MGVTAYGCGSPKSWIPRCDCGLQATASASTLPQVVPLAVPSNEHARAHIGCMHPRIQCARAPNEHARAHIGYMHARIRCARASMAEHAPFPFCDRCRTVSTHVLEAIREGLPAMRSKLRQVIPAALANLVAVLYNHHGGGDSARVSTQAEPRQQTPGSARARHIFSFQPLPAVPCQPKHAARMQIPCEGT